MFQNRVFRADTRNYTRNLETTGLSALVDNSFPLTDFHPISSRLEFVFDYDVRSRSN